MAALGSTFHKSRFLVCFEGGVWITSSELSNGASAMSVNAIMQTGPGAMWLGQRHEVGVKSLATVARGKTSLDVWLLSNDGKTGRKISVTYGDVESRPFALGDTRQGPAMDWTILMGPEFAEPVDMAIDTCPAEVQSAAR